jgi:hypothetical protein
MRISQRPERASVATPEIEALLDEYQVAAIMKRSVASLRRDRMLHTGVPHVKLSALVRYRPEDVRAFIARNLRGGEAGPSTKRGSRLEVERGEE